MSRSVVVVGGGLIGLSTGLLLSGRGANVTVLDHDHLGGGASRGNAGFLCTTLVEPLASPGALRSALGSLRDPIRPLRIHVRALPGMLGWGLHFARASTWNRHVAGRQALATLNSRHHEAIERLRDLGASIEIGPSLVVAFKSRTVAEHHLSMLAPMAEFGASLPDQMLDGDKLRSIVPALSNAIRAGYLLADDHSIDPRLMVDSMIEALRNRGVKTYEHAPVETVDITGSSVTAITAGGNRFEADDFVLAAGAGIRPLARKFGLRIPVVPGQGYNVALAPSSRLTHPVIFEEAHAVATPFADQIRLGGTMEFDGADPRFDRRRIEAIVESLGAFLDLDLEQYHSPWAGNRPMSPDGLPLLGRPHPFQNLLVAGGHGMFGLSLAPTTALALSELILDGRTATDLSDVHPDRFSLRPTARWTRQAATNPGVGHPGGRQSTKD